MKRDSAQRPAGEVPNGAADDGWQEQVTARAQWVVEEGAVARGYLLSRIELPSNEPGETWHAYVVRLTAPAKVREVGQQEAQEAKAGQEVLLGEKAGLRALGENLHARTLVEVEVTCLGKRKKGKFGNEPWAFRIRRNPRTLLARQGTVPMHVALPAAAGPAAPKPGDEVPF